MLKLLFILPLLMMSACATITTGTSQTLTITTTPAGASCVIDRNGGRVGAIPVTPGSVQLPKSGADLNVTCSKEGYQTALVPHLSKFNGATFGNLLLGGVVGVIVDASTGANFTYPEDLRMDLAANPGTVPPPGLPGTVPYVEGAPIRLSPVVQPVSSAGPTAAAVPKKPQI